MRLRTFSVPAFDASEARRVADALGELDSERTLVLAFGAPGLLERPAALAQRGPAPALLVSISCVGRRLVLGERTEEEIEATLEAMPEGTRQIGFYSYGELSPHTNGACELHNQTMTLTTVSESAPCIPSSRDS